MTYKVYLIDIEGRSVTCGYAVDEFLKYCDHEEVIIHTHEDGYELIFQDSFETYIKVFTDEVSKEFDTYLDSLYESGFKFNFTDCKVEDTSDIKLIEVIE